VPEIDVVAEDVDVEQLPDVLLLLVARETLLVGEFVPDLSEFLLDTLLLLLLVGTVPDVRDERIQPAHVCRHRI
jgi:hypothetical protein